MSLRRREYLVEMGAPINIDLPPSLSQIDMPNSAEKLREYQRVWRVFGNDVETAIKKAMTWTKSGELDSSGYHSAIKLTDTLGKEDVYIISVYPVSQGGEKERVRLVIFSKKKQDQNLLDGEYANMRQAKRAARDWMIKTATTTISVGIRRVAPNAKVRG